MPDAGVQINVGTVFDCCSVLGKKREAGTSCAIPDIESRNNGFLVLKPANENIKRTLMLVKEMLELADDGDARREDVGCGVLYGILRDAGYKIKKAAEAEKASHMKKGEWP